LGGWYPPVNQHSEPKNEPFIDNLPIKNCDVHSYVSLPEGNPFFLENDIFDKLTTHRTR
jgi:hypothetical protein